MIDDRSHPTLTASFEDYQEKIGYMQNIVDKPYTPPTDVKFYNGFLAPSRWYKLVIVSEVHPGRRSRHHVFTLGEHNKRVRHFH
jgi:hypothetical protein